MRLRSRVSGEASENWAGREPSFPAQLTAGRDAEKARDREAEGGWGQWRESSQPRPRASFMYLGQGTKIAQPPEPHMRHQLRITGLGTSKSFSRLNLKPVDWPFSSSRSLWEGTTPPTSPDSSKNSSSCCAAPSCAPSPTVCLAPLGTRPFTNTALFGSQKSRGSEQRVLGRIPTLQRRKLSPAAAKHSFGFQSRPVCLQNPCLFWCGAKYFRHIKSIEFSKNKHW